MNITEPVMKVLLGLADLVTLSRTEAERDQRGEPLEAHAPEAPIIQIRAVDNVTAALAATKCLVVGDSSAPAAAAWRAANSAWSAAS